MEREGHEGQYGELALHRAAAARREDASGDAAAAGRRSARTRPPPPPPPSAPPRTARALGRARRSAAPSRPPPRHHPTRWATRRVRLPLPLLPPPRVPWVGGTCGHAGSTAWRRAWPPAVAGAAKAVEAAALPARVPVPTTGAAAP